MSIMDMRQQQLEMKAQQAIIMNCPPKVEDGQEYYDTSWVMGVVQSSVKLLRVSGKLEHHPKKHHLVRFK